MSAAIKASTSVGSARSIDEPFVPAGLDDDSDLLRFTTAGSVDDGKSTLIGRLLIDTKTALGHQPTPATARSGNRPPGSDWASLGAAGIPLQAPPLLEGVELHPIITVGERAGSFVWAPLPDGVGAYSLGDRLVLHVNHEIDGSELLPGFRAAMVSRLELRLPDLAVLNLRYPVDGSEGFQRLCSASWAGQRIGGGSGRAPMCS